MKTVIFDLGRVLIHYDHNAVLSALSGVSQVGVDELLAIAKGFWLPVDTGRVDPQSFHHYLVRNAGTTPDFREFVAAACTSLARDEEAIARAMQIRRRAKTKIGIISNTNEIHAEWIYKHVSELSQFDDVILSHEVGLLKPDPAIYRLALERLEASPTEALFVDDREDNVMGARSVAMESILHRDWEGTWPQLEAFLNNRSLI